MDGRELSPSTRRFYAGLLGKHLIPEFGALEIQPAAVCVWHPALARQTGPGARANAAEPAGPSCRGEEFPRSWKAPPRVLKEIRPVSARPVIVLHKRLFVPLEAGLSS
jgi:hypothetical protein